MVQTNILFISDNYYLKSTLLGEYINSRNQLFGIELLQLATEKPVLKCSRKLALVDSGNIGAFYRYVNSKLKSKVSVAPLITPSGDVTSDPIVKAELSNYDFFSIFQIDNNIISSGSQQVPISSIHPVFTIAKS